MQNAPKSDRNSARRNRRRKWTRFYKSPETQYLLLTETLGKITLHMKNIQQQTGYRMVRLILEIGIVRELKNGKGCRNRRKIS